MSDTPRTDESVDNCALHQALCDMVEAEFARKLERELDEARDELTNVYRWIERNHPDGFIDSQSHRQNLERVTEHMHDKMDKLERERDEARDELRKLRIENNHNWQTIEFAEEAVKERDEALKQCGQLKAMRDAIKEAHGAISQCLKYILKLPLSGSDEECEMMDDAHHALRKLKPFIND
jgi:hypothetical protein